MATAHIEMSVDTYLSIEDKYNRLRLQLDNVRANSQVHVDSLVRARVAWAKTTKEGK